MKKGLLMALLVGSMLALSACNASNEMGNGKMDDTNSMSNASKMDDKTDMGEMGKMDDTTDMSDMSKMDDKSVK